jgi:hypothetical protein
MYGEVILGGIDWLTLFALCPGDTSEDLRPASWLQKGRNWLGCLRDIIADRGEYITAAIYVKGHRQMGRKMRQLNVFGRC